MTVPACVLNTLPHVNTSVVNDLRSLKLTGCDPAATATLQQARPSSMATPTQLQKVSQRVKNASLKLTTESTTHAPFMRRVNEIIKEFRVEKAIELKFRMGTQVEAKRHSAIKSGKVREAILKLSDADFKAALDDTKFDAKEVDIARSILTSSTPLEFDFLWEEDDHPVRICASLGNELVPIDPGSTADLWDELDSLDYVLDASSNVSRLAGLINALHKRLREAGEDVTTSRKVSAMVKALKPVSKFEKVIFEMNKQTFNSFTKAKDVMEKLLKSLSKLKKGKQEEAAATPNHQSSVEKAQNDELLMFKRFQDFQKRQSDHPRDDHHYGRGRGRGRQACVMWADCVMLGLITSV